MLLPAPVWGQRGLLLPMGGGLEVWRAMEAENRW